MIHKPPIDQLAEKIGSKYELCVVASKRARQIMEQTMSQNIVESADAEKPLSLAAQEIIDGKLISSND